MNQLNMLIMELPFKMIHHMKQFKALMMQLDQNIMSPFKQMHPTVLTNTIPRRHWKMKIKVFALH